MFMQLQTKQKQQSLVIAMSSRFDPFIYDTAIMLTTKIIHELFDTTSEESALAVAYSLNGHELVYEGRDETLYMVDTNTNNQSLVPAISYSMDGNILACGTWGDNVYLQLQRWRLQRR